MDDQSPNPYESPNSLSVASERKRPIGTGILAAVLFLNGIALAGGGAMRFNEARLTDPSFPTLVDSLRFVHIGFVAMTSVGASIGLLLASRLGWWSAVAFCYVGFSTFVLLPIVRNGVSHRIYSRIVIAGVCLLCWTYLHRRNVVAFFGENRPYRWNVHAGLFGLSLIVVFGLGIW